MLAQSVLSATEQAKSSKPALFPKAPNMEGVPLYVIGEMVGHSSTEMTKRYSHLCPDKKSQTVNVIQGIFAKGKAEETEKLSLKAIASARA